MLSWLLGLIPGLFTTINGITNAISNEKIAAINAKTQDEQIKATERVTSLQAQRDVLIQDANKSSLDIWIRAGYSIGPLVYLNKIFIYDKALGLGSTDALDPNLWYVVMCIIGFYTLHAIIKGK
jgi:hypothetical protein